MVKHIDICILGAGPGGVAAALQLAKLGLRCTLIDKALFPRDKICGDAISGKVISVFNKIDRKIFEDFYREDQLKADCFGVKFIFPNEVDIEILYNGKPKIESTTKQIPDGFISKRIDFDNFLVDYVKKEEKIEFLEGVSITQIEKVAGGYALKSADDHLEIQCKLVLVANGAQSKFARQFGGIHKEDRHYAGAIRAYYKNVKGITASNYLELHYIKELCPGYLWIFPLPNGQANVGLGMRTDKIKQHKVNLKKELTEILQKHPRFRDRFGEAVLTEKIVGFGLPFGSKKRKISGDHYMLIGDAAALIDPLTGEGIGNAVISGQFAALQAKKCLEGNNFSNEFIAAYDQKVYHRLWKELRMSKQFQNLSNYPLLINLVAKLVAKNKHFNEMLSAMFRDVDLRKKLRNPIFYIRFLLNR